jgi:hypothetical protein
LGLVHAAKVALSRLQTYVTVTVSVKANEALVLVEGSDGCDVSVGAGGRIDHEYFVGVLVPDPVTASTWNVCVPYASGPAYVFGLVHAVKLEPSRRQRNVAVVSLSLKENVAERSLVGFAGKAESVGGAVRRIVQA